jgi:hypothetical protein
MVNSVHGDHIASSHDEHVMYRCIRYLIELVNDILFPIGTWNMVLPVITGWFQIVLMVIDTYVDGAHDDTLNLGFGIVSGGYDGCYVLMIISVINQCIFNHGSHLVSYPYPCFFLLLL